MISLFRLNCRFCILHQRYYFCHFRQNTVVIAFQPSRERGESSRLLDFYHPFHASNVMLTHRLSAATAKKPPSELLYTLSSKLDNFSLFPQTSMSIASSQTSSAGGNDCLEQSVGVFFDIEAVPISSVSPPLVRASFLLRDTMNANFNVSDHLSPDDFFCHFNYFHPCPTFLAVVVCGR